MNLSPDQNEENALISRSRIIVENFFGRLKNKFSIMSDKYRSSRDKYETFFKICSALVNFDIMECGNLLHEDDGDYYIRLLTQQIFIEKKDLKN